MSGRNNFFSIFHKCKFFSRYHYNETNCHKSGDAFYDLTNFDFDKNYKIFNLRCEYSTAIEQHP